MCNKHYTVCQPLLLEDWERRGLLWRPGARYGYAQIAAALGLRAELARLLGEPEE